MIVRLTDGAFCWGEELALYYDLSNRAGVALCPRQEIGADQLARLREALIEQGWTGERVWAVDLGGGTRRELTAQPEAPREPYEPPTITDLGPAPIIFDDAPEASYVPEMPQLEPKRGGKKK